MIKKNIISLCQLILSIIVYLFLLLNFNFSFGFTPLSITMLFFCFYAITTFDINNFKENITIQNIICSFLFGITTILGREFLWTNQFFTHFTLFKLLFGFCQIIVASFIFYDFLIIINKINFRNNSSNFFMKLLNKNSIINLFLMIFICWIPYIILCYPAFVNPDSMLELAQFHGIKNSLSNSVQLINSTQLITKHHPVLYTYLIGFFSKFVNINIGLYIYNILQTLFIIFTISKLLLFVNQRINNNKILSYMLIAICFYPFIPYTFTSLEKDVLFTGIFVLFIINIYQLIFENKINIIKLAILSFLLISLRNNVLYVYILFIGILFFYLKEHRKNLLKITCLILIGLLGFQYFCIQQNISNGSKAEMLSIPLQQTAKYVTCYEKEVTKQEKTIINKVLEYKNIHKKYNPKLSDPIKRLFNNRKPTNNDLKDYLIIWIKMFFKHPLCYIDAMLNTQIGNFYINGTNIYTIRRSYKETQYIMFANNKQSNFLKLHFKSNHIINQIGLNVDKFVNIICNIPIIGYIGYAATYFWLYIIMCFNAINKRNKNVLIFASFYFLYLITILFGPCDTNYEFRYCYPFFVSCPIFYLIYTKLKSN